MSGGKPEMDKSETRGIVPGPATGVVKSYKPKRNPFGGFITDDATGLDIFVHKSAVEEAGMTTIDVGQSIKFDVVEDGFGGFKAVRLAAPD